MFQSEQAKLRLITWSILLFLLTASVLIYGGNGDDAYWHIKVGEWILTHQQVPTSGIFSYTNADKAWVSHEWLSAVFLYKIFQYSGWPGLVFFSLLCILASMLILLWFLLKRITAIQSLIFILFAFLLIAAHILPRPHILAIPIMTLWTACLIESVEKQEKPPFYLLPLMVLWVNMHGSFVTGIAFSVFFAAEAVFYAANEMKLQLAKNWGIFILGVIICAAITPHGIKGLLMPFQLSNQNYSLSIVSEWQSPNFQNFQALELWLISFLALVLMQGISLPLFRLIFLLGLLHLSLKHIRHACDLLSVLSPLILATPLATQWHAKPEIAFKDLWPKSYLGIMILTAYFGGLFFFLNNTNRIESVPNRQVQKVLQTLKPEQQQLGNVLNNYGIADFLIHLDYQTFIDTRSELYGDAFIKNYFDAINLVESSEKLETIIAKYHIGWTLFYANEPVNTYLATQPQWRTIYADKTVTVFVHKSVHLLPQTLRSLKTLEKMSIEELKKRDQIIKTRKKTLSF